MDATQLDTFGRAVQRLSEIRDERERELRRLMTEPSLYNVAEALQDEWEATLLHLCNFDHAVMANGKAVDAAELLGELQRQGREQFRRMTGKEYTPKGARVPRADRSARGGVTGVRDAYEALHEEDWPCSP